MQERMSRNHRFPRSKALRKERARLGFSWTSYQVFSAVYTESRVRNTGAALKFNYRGYWGKRGGRIRGSKGGTPVARTRK